MKSKKLGPTEEDGTVDTAKTGEKLDEGDAARGVESAGRRREIDRAGGPGGGEAGGGKDDAGLGGEHRDDALEDACCAPGVAEDAFTSAATVSL